MKSFEGINPTQLYYDVFKEVYENGDTLSPRGKAIKEIRPASVTFKDPRKRVTFLGGRKINPFFQIAESLWILSGRADVDWLAKFNENMRTFSDDGRYFNGSYGERMRHWNKNDLHNIIINPIDQLFDVYRKIIHDKDTRQAVIVLSNPLFDNSHYTIDENGKDICCNLILTFKVRNDKLHLTVFNRSNDVHWGLFGANLCQFTTIQETLWSWLKYSGKKEFENLELGEYCQVTDSLHLYLEDYGAKCNEEVLNFYSDKDAIFIPNINLTQNIKMSLNEVDFDNFLEAYWSLVDKYVMSDDILSNPKGYKVVLGLIDSLYDGDFVIDDGTALVNKFSAKVDEYWYFGLKAMLCYRLFKLGNFDNMLTVLEKLETCETKLSMIEFMKTSISKITDISLIERYNQIVKDQKQYFKKDYEAFRWENKALIEV